MKSAECRFIATATAVHRLNVHSLSAHGLVDKLKKILTIAANTTIAAILRNGLLKNTLQILEGYALVE